jgi:predicted AlkP superfamily phosphohydrolase/phosphomutase
MNARFIVLSLDGLSFENLLLLTKFLPRSRHSIKQSIHHKLDSGVLSGAQSIWAEILTGVPWYLNGCAGYSNPGSSLNNLHVCSEERLLTPPLFQPYETSTARSLVGNMPLLVPRPETRSWISNGSLPVAVSVSPSRLAQEIPPKFRAQACLHIAYALNFPSDAAKAYIANESEKLSLLGRLSVSEIWQRCFWRISLFDTLAHLLGIDFLQETELAITPALLEFLGVLDEILAELYSAKDLDVFLISGFSHAREKKRLNLNTALKLAGLLEVGKANSKQRDALKREELAAHATGGAPTAQSLITSEGRILSEKSLAASPIAGAVFINSKERFEDGIVDASEHASVTAKAIDAVKSYLSENGERVHTIEANNIPLSSRKGATPDFLVAVDGVEFHDVEEDYLGVDEHPLIVHAPCGFILTPFRTGRRDVTPTETAALLNLAR